MIKRFYCIHGVCILTNACVQFDDLYQLTIRVLPFHSHMRRWMKAMTAIWKKMYHNAHGHSKQY